MKRILLVGAGHAHSIVLRSLAEKPLYGARVALVSPAAKQLYSGMLPGVVAGLYRRHHAEIDVARLAEAAYAEFIEGTVIAINPAQRLAHLADGSELAYDLQVNANAADVDLEGDLHGEGLLHFLADEGGGAVGGRNLLGLFHGLPFSLSARARR